MRITRPDGGTFYEGSVQSIEEIESWGYPIPAGSQITYSTKEQRKMLRAGVVADIGDLETQIGKMKDVLDILVPALLIEVIVTGDNPSNEADRKRHEMLQGLVGDVDILTYAQEKLAAIKAGEILLSAPSKPRGVFGALDDAFAASTKFVQRMISAGA